MFLEIKSTIDSKLYIYLHVCAVGSKCLRPHWKSVKLSHKPGKHKKVEGFKKYVRRRTAERMKPQCFKPTVALFR